MPQNHHFFTCYVMLHFYFKGFVMHKSFVTTAPTTVRGGGGDSRGNERGFDQSFATAVWGKYLGFAL